MVQEDGHRTRPSFDSDEKDRIQRSNQIFLRLRKELHDKERQPTERDIREAVKSAGWLREVVKRHSDGLERVYKDALAASGLPDEDQAHLWNASEKAGGFSSFVQQHLQTLEEAAPAEGEHDPTESIAHQDLMCGVVAGLLAGGTMMGNSFYFGFAIGASRKANCW